jgi:hypothetical protein
MSLRIPSGGPNSPTGPGPLTTLSNSAPLPGTTPQLSTEPGANNSTLANGESQDVALSNFSSPTRPGDQAAGTENNYQIRTPSVKVSPPDGMENLGCFAAPNNEITTKVVAALGSINKPSLPTVSLQVGEGENGNPPTVWSYPVLHSSDTGYCGDIRIDYTAQLNLDKTCKTYLKLTASYDFENVHYQSEEVTAFCPDGLSPLSLKLIKPEPLKTNFLISPLR